MRALCFLSVLLFASCGDVPQAGVDGGDPFVSCETTKIAWVGDCDPNAKVCELDDGALIWFDGPACR